MHYWDVEAVVEVAAQHFVGDDRKWSFLAVTEAVKAGVRLAAFRESGYRMLLQGGEVSNEEELTILEENFGNGNGVSTVYPMNGHSQNGHKVASNGLDGKDGFVSKSLEGRAVAALNKFGQNARRLHPTPEPPVWLVEKPKPSLTSIWSAKVSLAVELTSLGIHSHATDLNQKGGKVLHLSTSERDELKRRKMMWAMYVMRDPFFANYTKRHLQKAEKVLNPVPIIGFLIGKLTELLEGIQTRYTYTSAS
ncbi:hypothetical protein QOZ80_2BG0153310 [Eleusine coracana subsp. coracana]|nr:hypothetical protein QOZ80_2BG0153310 [Eleusine coracana subsp. coracana]